jgi:hypothetical protein
MGVTPCHRILERNRLRNKIHILGDIWGTFCEHAIFKKNPSPPPPPPPPGLPNPPPQRKRNSASWGAYSFMFTTLASSNCPYALIPQEGFHSGGVLNDRRNLCCCYSHLSFPTHLWNFRLRRVLRYIHARPGAASNPPYINPTKWQITLVFFFFFFLKLKKINFFTIEIYARFDNPPWIKIRKNYNRKIPQKTPNFSQNSL